MQVSVVWLLNSVPQDGSEAKVEMGIISVDASHWPVHLPLERSTTEKEVQLHPGVETTPLDSSTTLTMHPLDAPNCATITPLYSPSREMPVESEEISGVYEILEAEQFILCCSDARYS